MERSQGTLRMNLVFPAAGDATSHRLSLLPQPRAVFSLQFTPLVG